MNRIRTPGFSVVEVGLIIAVIVIIGGLGFVFYTRWQVGQQTTQTTTTKSVVTTPSITKTSDLDKAASALDTIDVVSSADTNALNSNLSF